MLIKINIQYLGIYLSIACLGVSQVSYAGETIYQLKDSNGTTLLTNKHNKYSNLKVEKKTYYPDSNIHHYSNYGATEASVLPSHNKSRNAFDHIIQSAAQKHSISAGLIKAVMHTESGFNIHARSPVGAQGLMQLMPATARRFKVSNAYDPQQNIMAGAQYLAWLLKRFNGNTSLALAGYNAGEGNVQKYGGIPPFRETQDYVRRVNSRYQNLYANGVSSSSTNTNKAVINATSAIQNTPSHTTASHYTREVVRISEGNFTDRVIQGSYSSKNAIASAHITITD